MKAAVFDMDGLMLDTERLGAKIWMEEGPRLGYAVTEKILDEIRGTNNQKSQQILKRYFGKDFNYSALRQRCLERTKQEMEQNGVPVKKGLVELLTYLKEHGCQLAVATSTERSYALHFLDLAGVLPFFDQLVFGDMVQKSKPDPDIYLKAAQCLNVLPQDCMALEDSQNGILSASRAGMKVIMVPDIAVASAEVEKLLYAKLPSLLDVRNMIQQKGMQNI